MSPLHVAPPGPPQDFRAQVLSDTEILLTWSSNLLSEVQLAYDICYSTSTPVCDPDIGPVSAELT